MVGGTLGIAVLGTFIGESASQADFVASLAEGLLIGSFVALAGTVMAWTLISPELAGGAARPVPPAGEVAAPPAEPARSPAGA
ncbi:MAG: hypothetical protein ACRDLN_15050, partial [Solirubrobacteraceae bacterium]